MNASASYKYIPSESFAEFSTLNSDTGSLPQNLQPLVRLFSGSGDTLFGDPNTEIDRVQFNIFMLNRKIKYMFQVLNSKTILKILILAPEFINPELNQELVGLQNPQVFLAPDFGAPGASQFINTIIGFK